MKVKETEEKDDKVVAEVVEEKKEPVKKARSAKKTTAEEEVETTPSRKPNPLNPDEGMTFQEKVFRAYPSYDVIYVDKYGGAWGKPKEGREKITRK